MQKKIRIKRRIIEKTYTFISILLVLFIGVFSSWMILSKQWNQKYDVENYNCVDMSYDVGRFFQSIGIPTEIMYGSNPNRSTGHCWLLLWGWLEFESTSLSPHFFDKISSRYQNVMVVELI